MKIYVEYIHPLVKKAIKKRSEEIDFKEGFTIRDLAQLIEKKYKLKNLLIDDKSNSLKVLILINGSNTSDQSYNLKDNDKVHFLVFTTGG